MTRRPTTLAAMNAPADPPLLLMSLDQGVLRLTLNRAHARNALSSAMMTTLQTALNGADKNARVIVIAASGTVFSSGHDLKEMSIHRATATKAAPPFPLCSRNARH